jgi:hypothetical protein
MPRTLAAVQSSYIPWKGYFDLIRRSDEFILFDDVQFTKRDWRNRNRIKTKDGLLWLTIPVDSKGHYMQAIKDVRISEPGWNMRHWKTIAAAYARAAHFREYRDRFESAYARAVSPWLSEVNRLFIEEVCDVLGIRTPLRWSMEYTIVEGKSERLLSLCQQAGADTYLSGPSAGAYLDTAAFEAAGVSVQFMSYDGYKEYSQLFPPFEHQVSVLDVIFNEGAAAAALCTT